MSIAPPLKKQKLSSFLDDLSLNPNLIDKIKSARLLNTKDVLNLPIPDLQRKLKVSQSEAKNISEATSHFVLKNDFVSVFSFINNPVKSLFTPDILADVGGIYSGSVTEICGESGCGKTQICLHLSLQAQLPWKDGGFRSPVVYIHTEGDFPIRRFQQMSKAFVAKHPEFSQIKFSDNLILKKIFNPTEALHVFETSLPQLLSQRKPKLIIIDSVAALVRCESNSRSTTVQQLAHKIWKLANEFNVAVVCVNQVSGGPSGDVPSLGLVWSTVLTTRLRIYRTQDTSTTRRLEVVFSSYLPKDEVYFGISMDGVEAMGRKIENAEVNKVPGFSRPSMQ